MTFDASVWSLENERFREFQRIKPTEGAEEVVTYVGLTAVEMD